MKDVNGSSSSFVYLLKDKEDVVYVGQSASFATLMSRITSHRTSKVFDGVSFISTDRFNLNNLEAKTIVKFNPKYNENLPPNNKFRSQTALMNLIKEKIKMKVESKVTGNGIFYDNSEIEGLLTAIDKELS
jgi:excinuclease UvrABC nuclease subunit